MNYKIQNNSSFLKYLKYIKDKKNTQIKYQTMYQKIPSIKITKVKKLKYLKTSNYVKIKYPPI